MVYVKPFKGIRPRNNQLAAEVSALPYDVMNRQEAASMAEGNVHSILHITRAEIDLPEDVGDYDERVYEKAKENLTAFCQSGTLIREEKPVYYIYREIMNSDIQTGIVAAVSVDDYETGKVKKHELTRKEKEADRIHHFDVCDCQTEPVFFAYRRDATIDRAVEHWIAEHEPVYDFTAEDEVRHLLWVIGGEDVIQLIEERFAALDEAYIADGHHRTASATAISKIRKSQGLAQEKDDPANFVMAVIFPDSELNIMAYNRIVKVDPSFSEEVLFRELRRKFRITPMDGDFVPAEKHTFGMYWKERWYALKADPSLYQTEDVVANLDAAILQHHVLAPIFGIEDPRTDHRIDFIGGIRGNKEILRRCREENAIGFHLYPVEISDLMAVSDQGKMMPPKSTWFEPKLRSGLFLHSFKND